MRYTNRSDLLIVAGESIKMQEKFGIIPVFKFDGEIKEAIEWRPNYDGVPNRYEFPLAVVEGKAVFVGDELYGKLTGIKYIVEENSNVEDIEKMRSWNPPKPKTVMVELLREDAEYYANERALTMSELDAMIERREKACRKALEEK